MWPFKHYIEGECLRIGRHAVERWKAVDERFVLQAGHAFTPGTAPQVEDLAVGIQALYPVPVHAPITVILESAWLPVILVDAGNLLKSAQLEALVRHRFSLHHSDSAEPVETWELRIEHRAGSRHALAYGLPPLLKKALLDSAGGSGLQWKRLSPALGWGLERLHAAKSSPQATSWWVWPEQDRCLVARIKGNEVVGLNAGVMLSTDEASLMRCIDAESVRVGMASNEELVTAATWGIVPAAPQSDKRVVWIGMQGLKDVADQSDRAATTQAVV